MSADSPASLLIDAAGNQLPVTDGTPVGTAPALLSAGRDDSANAQIVRTAADGTVRVDPTGTTAQPVTDGGGSLTVDGTVGVSGSVAVTGPLTDAQLRAAALPLPTGAATSALQTQPGVDIGDVTINNAAGAAAVNIQDGGNSITVDGSVSVSGSVAVTGPLTDTQLRASAVPVSAASLPLPTGASTETTLASIDTKTLAAGQAAMAASSPVVIASNQTVIPVSDNADSLTVDSPQLPTALIAGRLNANVGAWLGSTAPSVGQKTMSSSVPVVFSSDQTALPVTLTAGSGGANQADKSAFVEGATQFNPIGGVRNDTLTSDPAEDQAAAARITPKRALHINLRDQIGVELGTSVNPLITALQGTASTVPGFNFGDVTTVAIVSVAVRRTVYTEPATNAQRSMSSSSALDTAAGTGARTVSITYFDVTGAGPFVETITLNGLVAVNTVATNICFIEKLSVQTAGVTGSNAGIVTLFGAAGGLGGVVGTIGATDIQTFWCHHYVAAGKTASITAQWAGHNGTTVGSGATFRIRAITLGAPNQVESQISDSFRLYGQSSSVQRSYGTPIKIVGPARITTHVLPETATSVNYRASFDFFEQ